MSPYRYCFNCAHPLHEPPPTCCGQCGQRHFLNPKPCGEAVVIEHERVLLLVPLGFPGHMGAMLRAAARLHDGSAGPLPDRAVTCRARSR